jgi:hypothetical protein
VSACHGTRPSHEETKLTKNTKNTLNVFVLFVIFVSFVSKPWLGTCGRSPLLRHTFLLFVLQLIQLEVEPALGEQLLV